MKEDRPYQDRFISDARAAMARSKHVFGVLPTGAGKTTCAAIIARNAREKRKRVIFTCHRDFLIDQTAEEFDEAGVPYTLIAPGESYNPHASVVIASIDTLKRRLDKIEPCDLLIPDEAIHSAAEGWAKTIEYFQSHGCYTLGLGACPERLSGKGLGKWFKELVLGPTTAELIELGYLSKYKAYAPSQPDLSNLHMRGGEYLKEEVSQAMNKPSITGDIVREYVKLAPGKQAIGFFCSLEHSRKVCEALIEAGFRAVHIGSDTSAADRRIMLRDYGRGDIQWLTSVDIFNEGYNVPRIQYVALGRPTQSYNIFKQQAGRGLRMFPGKDFLYLVDHANQIATHGFPDDDHFYTLEDRVKGSRDGVEKAIPSMICERCYASRRPFNVCPECGFERAIQSREIEEIDGELQEIHREEARKQVRIEQGMTKTEEGLIERFMAEGSTEKNAIKRAGYVLAARKKKEDQNKMNAAKGR